MTDLMLRAARRRLATILSVCAITAALVPLPPVSAVSPSIVISQVYGGGGNSGAVLTHDFIELYNRSSEPVSVAGWSVQYLAASGNGTWQTTPLNGVVGPGEYFLVQQAPGAGGTVNLPPPDAVGTIAISATAGHVALVDRQTALPANTCSGLTGVIDFVGYGTAVCHEGAAAAPAASNTTALLRARSGCADSEENAADFLAGGPDPRNRRVTSACDSSETPLLSIAAIQGAGDRSPLAGKSVRTPGVVTGLKSNGFFIQTPDADIDADPLTSEGLFVFTSAAPGRTLGEYVTVSGLVQEFVPPSDTASPPLTEIVSPAVDVASIGNALPAPVVVTPADTLPEGGVNQLEKYEGMRVTLGALTVIAPTAGSTNERAATGASNGVFYGVLAGLRRPVREPGIDVLSPLPPGAPSAVPRFDGNPERLRVDSDAQPGTRPLEVATGMMVSGLTGPLDYGFRTYTVLPDPAIEIAIGGSLTAVPVSSPASGEFTVASANLQRFFDTADDPDHSDAVLTPAAFDNRLTKASLAIRTVLGAPDVIGVSEMENLDTLEALAARVNADALAAGDSDPGYRGILEEGNDIGGIDVGFLVRGDRVTIDEYAQIGKDVVYADPASGALDLLNDRPPLLLHATVHLPGAQPRPIAVMVNHLRSLSGIEDPGDGARVRAKRQAQAEYVARQVQALQQSAPDVPLILVGDLNAFTESDGYVDVVGTIAGRPAPADQVVVSSPDLVDPDLLNLSSTVRPEQQYSYVFDGNAQELDHIMVNQAAAAVFTRLEYGRSNADFPESYRSDPNRPERVSDHDMLIAYFATVPTSDPPRLSPLMRGDGFVADQRRRHRFTFVVSAGHAEPPKGRLRYSVAVMKGRGGQWKTDEFRSTDITAASWDQPDGSGGERRAVVQVTFEGTGSWNGASGYTFVARAIEGRSPDRWGRPPGRFAMLVRDRRGRVVASVDAALDGGAIETRPAP